MKGACFGVPLRVAAYVLAALLLSFPAVAAQAQQVVMFSSDAAPVHSQLFIANGDGTGERPLSPRWAKLFRSSAAALHSEIFVRH